MLWPGWLLIKLGFPRTLRQPSAAALASAFLAFQSRIPRIQQTELLELRLWSKDCPCSPRIAPSDDRGWLTPSGEGNLDSDSCSVGGVIGVLSGGRSESPRHATEFPGSRRTNGRMILSLRGWEGSGGGDVNEHGQE